MSDHAAPPAAEGEAPAGPKSKLPLIAIMVVSLAVGGGSGAALVGPMVAKKMGYHAAPAAKPADGAEEGGHDAAPAEEHGEAAPAGEHGEKAGAAAPPVLTLENLVLNPASSGGSRYLLLSIAIEAADEATKTELTNRDAELKDVILTTLSKKTVEELVDVASREPIKTELIAAITERFGKKSVKQLYFPQFVIQ